MRIGYSIRMRSWIRTLKIDILTLFISLTIITFACVICYSFIKNYSAILNYSKSVMERNSTAIITRIQNLQNESIQVLEDTSGLFISKNTISVSQEQLILFGLHVLKTTPDIAAFFLAFDANNLILITDINLSSQTHFETDPSKPLPPNTAYVVKISEATKKPYPEIWYYKDKSFKTLASEQFPKINILTKTRPWYIGALQNKTLYWTDFYRFANTGDLGITLSKPVFDDRDQLVGILGVDLSIAALSNFLKKQKIGATGRVFITDSEGNLLVPEAKDLSQSKISLPIIQAAVQHYNKTKEYNFSFHYNGTRYLSFVRAPDSLFNKDWLVVTIVPFGDFFYDLIRTQIEIIFITLAILVFSIIIIIYFSKRISQPIVQLAKEIDKITNLHLSSENRIDSPIVEIKTMDASVAALRTAMRSFSRYVPKQIVKHLLSQGKDISLNVEKKTLTIMFSDIQDFTTISEKHPLDMLMPLLNQYFDGLSKIILDNKGTIDKYIGDSIMSFWGAPLENSQHAILACKTALKCQAFVLDFNQKCREQNQPEFITRFGISSGTVVVGNIGTLERMNYTVIGDAVNTAARLQVTDKLYRVNIIISDAVYRQTQHQFLTRPLDTVTVKGKKTEIKIYHLMATLEPHENTSATTDQKELCQAFTQAYQAFIDKDYITAKQLFTQIHQKFPHDYPTELYLNRLTEINS